MTDCPWDLNGDGKVDDTDFEIFKLAYPSKIGDANWNAACDFNNDGEVDSFDFAVFASYYGTTCPGVTPPPTTTITCNGATPHYSSGCALLKHYDADADGIISDGELLSARKDRDDTRRGTVDLLTSEEYYFVHAAKGQVSINALCPGCTPTPTPQVCTPYEKRCYNENTVETCRYNGDGWTRQTCPSGYTCINGECVKTSEPIPVCTPGEKVCTSATKRKVCKADGSGWHYSTCPSGYECENGDCVKTTTPTPTPPPNMETRTVSLSEGQHTIQVSLSGYDTLNATINVTASGVSCITVVGGNCGGSGLPRVSTSGWTASAYLKSSSVAAGRCAWISTQNTSMVAFISNMVLAYNNLQDIGFVPSASEIGDGVLMYSNLGTPASLWGC